MKTLLNEFDTWWDSHIGKIGGGLERGIAYQDIKSWLSQKFPEYAEEIFEKALPEKRSPEKRDGEFQPASYDYSVKCAIWNYFREEVKNNLLEELKKQNEK